MNALRWGILPVLLGAFTFYVVNQNTEKEFLSVPVRLSFPPLDSDSFLTDTSFKWLHRHCQPANPFDTENREGGWLKSLEKMSGGKVRLSLNSSVKWGSGQALETLSILNAFKKSLVEGELLNLVADGTLELTTQRSNSEVLELLQGLLILPGDESLLKKGSV